MLGLVLVHGACIDEVDDVDVDVSELILTTLI